MRSLPTMIGLALLGAACTPVNPLAPSVLEVRLVQDTQDTTGGYEVQALVRDLAGVAKVQVHYTGLPATPDGATDAGHVTMARMLDAGDDRYSATLPGFPLGTTVRYAVEVCNVIDICTLDPAGWPDEEAYAFVVGEVPSRPHVLEVHPPRGPTAGGIRIEVVGEDFRPGMLLFFGTNRAIHVEVLKTTLAACLLPAGEVGTVNVTARNPDNQQGVLRDGFTYYTTPEPLRVIPDHGPTQGGTPVVVEGRFFPEGARVTFEGRFARHVVVESDTRITCVTPPGNPGPADVAVIHPEGGQGVLPDGYRYVPPPRVDSVQPAEGPDFGGQTVTVTGDYFEPGATVTVGGQPCVDVVVQSATTLTCTVPAGTPGAADVTVLNPDDQSGTLPGGYFYNGPPVVVAVDPHEGPIVAGEEVTVFGAGFLAGIQVFFDGQPAVVVGEVSRDRVTVQAPAAAEPISPAPPDGIRSVTVKVTNALPDGRSAELADAYSYLWPPEPLSVTPGSGPTLGGTNVVILGRFFRSIRDTPITVRFDAAPVAAVSVVSTTEIHLFTPAGDPGPADVAIRNHLHSEGVGAGLYLYVPPPQPTQVVPPDGPTFGGETVTVLGTGFQPGAIVTLDGAPCDNAVVAADGRSLTCTTPPGTVGLADVVVNNPDNQSGTLTDGYRYLAVVVQPNGGLTTGFTRTRVLGAGMHEGVVIRFGTVEAPILQRVSDREVIVNSPPHALGVVDVGFRNLDGTGETAEQAFTFRGFTNRAADRLSRDRWEGNDGEAVDVDHDGDLDVVVANGQNSQGAGSQPGTLYRNRGDGSFDVEEFTPDYFATKVSAGDVNGDGWEDLLFSATTVSALYLNDGTGHFRETPLPTPSGPEWWDGQIVDLTGDGRSDIFLLGIGCPSFEGCDQVFPQDTFLVNLGGGAWEDRSALIPNDDGNYHDHKFATWDLDGDGLRDLIITVDNVLFPAPPGSAHANRQRVLMNRSTGFVEVDSGDFGRLVGNVWGISVGDVNGDGLPDLALPSLSPDDPGPTGMLGNTSSATLLMGAGGTRFHTDETRLGVGHLNESTNNAVLVDLDQDGDLEIIYCNAGEPSRLFVNKGDGQFVEAVGVLPDETWVVGDMVAGDFDHDGDVDLVVIKDGQDVLLRADWQVGGP